MSYTGSFLSSRAKRGRSELSEKHIFCNKIIKNVKLNGCWTTERLSSLENDCGVQCNFMFQKSIQSLQRLFQLKYLKVL